MGKRRVTTAAQKAAAKRNLVKARAARVVSRGTPESRQRRKVMGALRRLDAAKAKHNSGDTKIPGTDMNRALTRKSRLNAVEHMPQWKKTSGGWADKKIGKAKEDRKRMVRKVMGR